MADLFKTICNGLRLLLIWLFRYLFYLLLIFFWLIHTQHPFDFGVPLLGVWYLKVFHYVPRVISFLIFTFYFKSFIKLFPLLELLIFKIFSLSFSVHLLNSSQDILIVFCGRCFSSCVIRSPCKISAFSCAFREESTPDQSCWTIHLPIAAVYKYPWAFGRLRLPVTVLLAS